jgi:hypothetical protein
MRGKAACTSVDIAVGYLPDELLPLGLCIVQKRVYSRLLSKNINTKIQKILVFPVVLDGYETLFSHKGKNLD